METGLNNYNLLIRKLDEFIRKYHLNQVIRGSLYAVSILLIAFLTITVSEYYFFFSTAARKILFYGFLLGGSGFTYFAVIRHLLHYYHLGDIISHEKAAQIVGKHFPDVQDKLLNVLQLSEQRSGNDYTDLIKASIDQKIEKLNPIPFKNAVDLSKNTKYLRYAVPPLLIFVGILIMSPNLIKDSTTRLIHNNVYFEKEAPFRFEVLNEKLEVLEFENLELDIEVSGESLPDEAYITIDGYTYKLNKQKANQFSYELRKLQKNVEFSLNAEGFHSRDYEVNVIAKPMILGFDIQLKYPSYLGIDAVVTSNVGDLTIPEGTYVEWQFTSRNTDEISMRFLSKTILAEAVGNNYFTYKNQFFKDAPYTIFVSNEQISNADSIKYGLHVIPDQYPVISVEQIQDSTSHDFIYFMGEISDDHGLSKLNFNYKTISENQPEDESFIPLRLDIEKNTTFYHYSHFLNLKEIELKPGEKLLYFFEVWDNDGLRGSKASRTVMMEFEMPTTEQMDEQTAEKNEKIKKDLEKTIRETSQLKQELIELKDKLHQKKNLSWDDKQSIKELMEKQNELNAKVEQIQKDFRENLAQQKDYKKMTPEIKEKYEKLQELFEEVLDEEMKKLIAEIEKLMDKLNKEKALKDLERFEYDNKEMEKELDRMLALFKQLELEQKMNEAIDRLKKLAEEEQKLSQETLEKKSDKDKNIEKQEGVKQDFEKLKEEIAEMNKINQEFGNKEEIDKNNQQELIDQNINESLQQLQKNKRTAASQSQQNASQAMQKLSKDMQDMMDEQQEDQLQVDLDAIRQILENLIGLSFEQEDLMDQIKTVNINSPEYKRLVKEQHNLKENAKMIEDSLFALSKRIVEIESYVNKEIAKINNKMAKSIQDLADRRKPNAAKNQQYVMTSVNNIALMLTEVMEQLQKKLAAKSQCKNNCQKPGGKASSMGKMSKMQKDLNKKLGNLQKKQQAGKVPKQEMSRKLSQMAAQQSALREALRELNQRLNKDGKGSLGNLEEVMKDMEKTETDIVNKRLTEEMMQRQKEILTRLLYAANAEREREVDEKRKAEKANEYSKELPPEIEEYLKKRQAELELYKTLPPNLQPYYRELVEKYFKSISY